MKAPLCGLLVAWCAAGAGCQLVVQVSKDAVYEVGQRTNEVLEKRRDRKLAEQAWADYARGCPGNSLSSDFGDGFQCGYADYLFAGGDGEPPLLPPPRYWGVRYETAEGNQAVQDWFAGFRAGARAARASGQRDRILLPLSSAPPAGPPPGPPGPPPDAAPGPAGEPAVPEDRLPPPRKEGGPAAPAKDAPLGPPEPAPGHD